MIDFWYSYIDIDFTYMWKSVFELSLLISITMLHFISVWFDKFQSEDIRDNFVVCGDPYNTFREKLAQDLIKDKLLDVPSAVKVTRQNLTTEP